MGIKGAGGKVGVRGKEERVGAKRRNKKGRRRGWE